MIAEPKKGVPCPVCCGAGYWDKLTGHPIFTTPPDPDAQRCVYCEGAKLIPYLPDHSGSRR